MTSYPPSTVAYPLLNQLLDSFMHLPVSSTASTVALTSMPVSSCDTAPTITSLPVSSATTTTSLPVSSASATTSSSTLPPISSLVTAAAQTSSSPIHSSSFNLSPSSSNTAPLHLPLLPQDAVATSPHLQQYSAVRQLTHNLQLRKPRHPKRHPRHPSPGEAGTSVRRIVHTSVYKQKLYQNNQTLKQYEDHIDELLKQTTAELDKSLNTKLQPSLQNYANLNIPSIKFRNYPLRIQIPSHNWHNCSNFFQCYTPIVLTCRLSIQHILLFRQPLLPTQ